MAITKVPGYNPRGYVYGGASLPVAKAIVAASTPKITLPPAAEMPGFTLPGAQPPTTSTPNTTLTVPGSTVGKISPSYNLELTGDFAYDPTIEAYNSAIKGARSSLGDQIKQAVIRSGYGDILSRIPSSLADYAGDLDPATLATAAGNQLSDRAVLQRQLDKGMSDLAYALAARGTARSGAYAAGAGALDQQYQQATEQQVQGLLDAISGGVRSYNDIAANAATQRNSALQQIADRLSRLPGAVYGGETAGGEGGGGGGGDTGGGGGQIGPITPNTASAAGPNDPSAWLPGISDAAKAAMQGVPTGGVKWDGREWFSWDSLSRYIKSRGGNPIVWAQNHPDARARL